MRRTATFVLAATALVAPLIGQTQTQITQERLPMAATRPDAVAARRAAADAGQRAFIATLAGRPATLKHALYTLVPTGGRVARMIPGVTVVSPDQGLYYRDEAYTDSIQLARPRWNGRQVVVEGEDAVTRFWGTTVDRDPERLATIVNLRIVTYAPPLTLTIADVGFRGMGNDVRTGEAPTRVVLALADPLQPAVPVTALTVQWPAAFSAAFTERPEVERLIASVLAVPED